MRNLLRAPVLATVSSGAHDSSPSVHVCGFEDPSLPHRPRPAPPIPQQLGIPLLFAPQTGHTFFGSGAHASSPSPHVYGFDDPSLPHRPRHAPPIPQQLGIPLLLAPQIGQTFFVSAFAS